MGQEVLQEGYGALDPATLPFTMAVAPDAARFVDDEQFEWGLRAILDGIEARHPGD